MEGLSPSISLLLCVRRSLDQGISVGRAVDTWVQSEHGDFRDLVLRWRLHQESNVRMQSAELARLSPWRRTLLDVLGRGLAGESIARALEGLEDEMMRAADAEMHDKLVKMPFLAMIPVLLFQLPAFLLLLFGPLVQNFLHSLGG